jgi:mRNA interferase HicA
MKYSELFRILKKEGWNIIRKSGSHYILENSVKEGRIIIPFHSSKEVKKGLLKDIIKKTGIKTDKR